MESAKMNVSVQRYLSSIENNTNVRRSSDVMDDKQAIPFPRVKSLAQKYDQMISNHTAVKHHPKQSRQVQTSVVSVNERRQVFEHGRKALPKPTMNPVSPELLQLPTRKRRSLKKTPKFSGPLIKQPLQRSSSDTQVNVHKSRKCSRQLHCSLSKLDSFKSDYNRLKRNGCHMSPVNFDVWCHSNDTLDVSCSQSPASLASPCESLEEIPILLRSIPFEYFRRKCYRSNSSDSAVVVDDFHSSFSSSPNAGVSPSLSPNELVKSRETPQSSNGYGDRKHRILCSESDSGMKDPSVTLRSTPGRSLKPPSVVISDHTGATFVAVPSRLPQGASDNSLLAHFLGTNQSMDYTICPRKVSDCSTCSSVSTVDMNGVPNYENLHVDIEWGKRDSDCSSCLTASDEEIDVLISPASPPKHKKSSNWRKVRNVVQWTPFIQTYKRHKYPWVQLAGHQGNFKAGYRQGTILKKLCPAEQCALETLKTDVLSPFVPEYLGQVESSDSEKYLQLQDLLGDFSNPCVMDIKMGVRTYLEEELAKARHKPKLRKDMYDKMVQIDASAPTEAENRAKAVTKPRYMVWRETISSTATLGFRIEGVRRSDGTSTKDFKTTRTRDQVTSALLGFVQGYPHALPIYLERLKEIQSTLDQSKFFKSHELIGSSLLFVHNETKAGVWLIDFAKTIPLPKNVKITHSVPWVEGTHEDGYLIGLNNLTELIEAASELPSPPTEAKDPVPVPKEEVSETTLVNNAKNSNHVVDPTVLETPNGQDEPLKPLVTPCKET